MGKTKLLWELKQLVDLSVQEKQQKASDYDQVVSKDTLPDHAGGHDFFANCVCDMILCHGDPTSDNKVPIGRVFTHVLNVFSGGKKTTSESISNQLDDILEETVRNCTKNDISRVVLLFDESQFLVANDDFAFRCVRWWLRKKRTLHVVAVFTRTTLQLNNFFKEPATSSNLVKYSMQGTDHYDSGSRLYDPFWTISTIGLFAGHQTNPTAIELSDHEFTGSDYENAIPYGRPLFAVMQREGILTEEAEFNTLKKMILNRETNSKMTL